MKKWLFVLFGICLIRLLGCSSGVESTSLKSTSWQLDSLAGLNIVPAGKNVTLEFNANTKISGFGGCNKYGGSYKTSGKNISFNNVYSTEMACDNMQVESTFYAALKKADSYNISGSKLMLYERGALLASFRAQ